MANKEPKLIDGFASVQAVRRTGKAPEARLRHSATRLPGAEDPPVAPAAPPVAGGATRIGHTAIPQKHDMVCYECLYAFTVSGKVHYTFCPKCKRNLDMSDHVLSGDCGEELRTMGSIDIRADAVLREGVRLLGQNIIVAGDASQAKLEATRRLELAPGGKINWATCAMKEVRIQPDALLVLRAPLVARVVDIGGTLRGTVRADDLTQIRATATFTGELNTPRLQIEDGAFIRADMVLGRDALATAATNRQDAA